MEELEEDLQVIVMFGSPHAAHSFCVFVHILWTFARTHTCIVLECHCFSSINMLLLFFLQVDKWGLVEGGHDIDIADLRVQIASVAVFLGFSRRS